jgi:hypothetical protein
VELDRARDLEPRLRAIAPDLIVDASGPFQAYGKNPYRVVETAIALGIHYIDLSDGADFVRGITRFDDAARARGVFVLSGVSSCPVLTAAVVRRLSVDMARVESIAGGIAPSPYADIGLNVIRATASYAGKPWRSCATAAGRWRTPSLTRAPSPSRRRALPPCPALRRSGAGSGPPRSCGGHDLDGGRNGARNPAARVNALAWLAAAPAAVAPSTCDADTQQPHAAQLGRHRGGMFVA